MMQILFFLSANTAHSVKDCHHGRVTNYLQEVPKGRDSIPSPCSTLGYYILALYPSAVSEETASVVRPFQVSIVLGKNEFLKPAIYTIGQWYCKGWDLILLHPL